MSFGRGNPVEPKIYEEVGTPPLRQREEVLQWQFVTTSANIPSQSKPDFVLPSKPFLVMEESLLTYRARLKHGPQVW